MIMRERELANNTIEITSIYNDSFLIILSDNGLYNIFHKDYKRGGKRNGQYHKQNKYEGFQTVEECKRYISAHDSYKKCKKHNKVDRITALLESIK